jgi:hypothetical protein
MRACSGNFVCWTGSKHAGVFWLIHILVFQYQAALKYALGATFKQQGCLNDTRQGLSARRFCHNKQPDRQITLLYTSVKSSEHYEGSGVFPGAFSWSGRPAYQGSIRVTTTYAKNLQAKRGESKPARLNAAFAMQASVTELMLRAH